jgi:hypothetical protein
MTILTSQTTFTVGEAAIELAAASLTILPVTEVGSGKGRLVHPALGAYDYPHAPDEWSNMDGDALIAPIWASAKTLDGSANTLFAGSLRDVVVEERWNGELTAPMAMVRMLASFWQNPPDPALDYVQWYPSYANALGFKVIVLALDVNGQGINLDYISRQGWVTGNVVLRMKLVGRV